MLLQLLGTGNPSPSLKRMSSGYLIRVGDDLILFDHGPGAYHRLLEAGYTPMDPTHVVFSHLHYDHCLDYVRLVLTRWDQGAGKTPELEVYGPPPLEAMTRALFAKEGGAFGPDLRARTEHRLSLDIYEERGGKLPRRWPEPHVHEIRSNAVMEGNGWTIRTTSAIHAQPQLQCYAYRLDCDDGSVVYSGDSGPSRRIGELAKDCDVLVHMCAYESGRELSGDHAKTCTGHLELARLAAEANVQTLVLTHFNTKMDQPGVRERLIGEIARTYTGTIVWGEDLLKIRVPPTARV